MNDEYDNYGQFVVEYPSQNGPTVISVKLPLDESIAALLEGLVDAVREKSGMGERPALAIPLESGVALEEQILLAWKAANGQKESALEPNKTLHSYQLPTGGRLIIRTRQLEAGATKRPIIIDKWGSGEKSPPIVRRPAEADRVGQHRGVNVNPRENKIRRQVERLEELRKANLSLIEVDLPEDLSRLWTNPDHQLRLTLIGLQCNVESPSGAITVADRHPLLAQFHPEFPAVNEITFTYDWMATGGAVAFHPNIVSRYELQANRQPGYMCLFAQNPPGLTLARCVIQAVDLLTYRLTNPGDVHKLNPRASALLVKNALKGLSGVTVRPPFTPTEPRGGGANRTRRVHIDRS